MFPAKRKYPLPGDQLSFQEGFRNEASSLRAILAQGLTGFVFGSKNSGECSSRKGWCIHCKAIANEWRTVVWFRFLPSGLHEFGACIFDTLSMQFCGICITFRSTATCLVQDKGVEKIEISRTHGRSTFSVTKNYERYPVVLPPRSRECPTTNFPGETMPDMRCACARA